MTMAKVLPINEPKPKPQIPSAEEVRYQLVMGDDIKILQPVFDRLGWPLPDPALAKVIIAIAGEGESAIVCGFSVVQFVLHSEPLWVAPPMLGLGIAEALAQQTADYLEGKSYLAIAKEGSFAARLCEKHGMKPRSGILYEKRGTQ